MSDPDPAQEYTPTIARRLLLGIFAAGSGWLGGMGFLKTVHPWAYETEFRWWAFLTGAYALLLMLVTAAWIAKSRPGTKGRLVAGAAARFALAGTLLPLCLAPVTAGLSIVLLMSGQAYVVAGIAAVVYVSMALQRRPRSRIMHPVQK